MPSRYRIAALLAALALSVSSAVAQETTKLRFTLDWKLQGIHAWYFWAQEKGYFAAEKLDVTVDQGEGSAATVTRVMSGAYDAGFGDVNAIIQNAAVRPADAPVMVYMIYSKAPFVLLTKAASPIRSVKDMAGKKLGSPAGAAALRLFPLLAAKNGLDPTKVEIVNMAPNLQEQMLLQGQVDISAVFSATSYMNLVALKLDPDKDFRWIYFSEFRRRPLFQRRDGVAQARQGEARSGEGSGPRHQPCAEGRDGEPRRRRGSARGQGAADQEGHREAAAHLRLQDADRHLGGARARHRRRQRCPHDECDHDDYGVLSIGGRAEGRPGVQPCLPAAQGRSNAQNFGH